MNSTTFTRDGAELAAARMERGRQHHGDRESEGCERRDERRNARRQWQDLDLLSMFVSVAEASSFSLASKRLRLPKSSVSRGVARLEDALGAQLLHRTTRHVSLTTAGSALYERTAPLLTSLLLLAFG